MKKGFLLMFVIGVFCLFLASCEPLCKRKDHLQGPAYYATYVYKFKEGHDYSQNVMVMALGDQMYFNPGYRPIPLHDGYYLDGPLLQMEDVSPTIYYLDFTYDDITNGTAPVDWQSNWEKHIIPCWNRWNNYAPYDWGRCRGYSWCGDIPSEDLYNDTIILETPFFVDTHIDTNILNSWIDNNSLNEHFMYGI